MGYTEVEKRLQKVESGTEIGEGEYDILRRTRRSEIEEKGARRI